ncbi:ABC-three component system protein [Kocuria sp. ICS0012]|uniref:ABC-three component system protein n=1 Tax=Kocuria sp. ICS0012 TaxID=1834155 RepID=UPI000A53ECE3|nr:ABC-three component system protein [Kocuria sp. ICS0012]
MGGVGTSIFRGPRRLPRQHPVNGRHTLNCEEPIIDYHRAITQETEWLSDSLLDRQELRNFEEELRFEWQREFENMVYDLDLDDLNPSVVEKAKIKAGRKLLNYLLQSTAVTVRSHYNEGFYGRGKRHELAGHHDVTQRIGWHPDFAIRLEALVLGA